MRKRGDDGECEGERTEQGEDGQVHVAVHLLAEDEQGHDEHQDRVDDQADAHGRQFLRFDSKPEGGDGDLLPHVLEFDLLSLEPLDDLPTLGLGVGGIGKILLVECGVHLCLYIRPAAVDLLLGEFPQLRIIVGGADGHPGGHAPGEDVAEAVDGGGHECVEVHDKHQQNHGADHRPERDALSLHIVVGDLEQHHGGDERPSGDGDPGDTAELVGDDARAQGLQEPEDARPGVLADSDKRQDGGEGGLHTLESECFGEDGKEGDPAEQGNPYP